MTERELTWLASQARNAKVIVEFGCFYGRSTRALADNTNGIIYAVDPWNGDYPGETGEALKNINTYVYPNFKQNLKDHIESGRVKPVRAYSNDYVGDDNSVDMLFIDGDHNYKTVKDDILHALQLVRPGGIICGHDYDTQGWPDVKRVVQEIFSNVEVEDTIWHLIKS